MISLSNVEKAKLVSDL